LETHKKISGTVVSNGVNKWERKKGSPTDTKKLSRSGMTPTTGVTAKAKKSIKTNEALLHRRSKPYRPNPKLSQSLI
jgi:hypothetical protein